MAVKLRLRRMGKKRQPIYKIVAADARSPRDGKYLEAIGTYNPLTDPHEVSIQEDRALYWLKNGAQPTETVRSLLRQNGVTHKKELVRRGLSDEAVAAEMAAWLEKKEARRTTGHKKIKKAETTGTAEAKGAASEESASVSE